MTTHKLFTPRLRYDGEDEALFGPNAKARLEVALAKQIGETLYRHYPGHAWFVEVKANQGIAFVTIPVLLGNWKYVLKLADLKSDPGLRSVVRAGGEILERFRVPRSGIDIASFLEAKNRRVSRASDTVPV